MSQLDTAPDVRYGHDTERFLQETPGMEPIVKRLALQIALAERQVEQKHAEIAALNERNRLDQERLRQRDAELAQEASRLRTEEERNSAIYRILSVVDSLSLHMQANLEACTKRACTPNFDDIKDTLQVSLELIRLIAARVLGQEELKRLMREAQRKSDVIVNAGTHIGVTGDVHNIVEGVQHYAD